MKYLFSCLLFTYFLLAFLPTSAQSQTDPDKVFVYVEEMPQFVGGQDSLLVYLAKNLHYPPDAIKNNQSGIVFVSFVVDKKGEVTKPEILKSVTSALDAEALRVISKMPAWIPGKQSGQPVAVKFTLPVRFQLKNEVKADTVFAFENVKDKLKEKPEFPGGETEMMRYLAKNINYPVEAIKNGIQGLTVISFTVNTDGSLSDYQVRKRLGYGTDEEAIRVLQTMPLWKPGKMNGQPVRVRYTLPVRFTNKIYYQ